MARKKAPFDPTVAQTELNEAAASTFERIDRDTDAAKAAGIRGTPGFLINGLFLSGAQPIGKFRKVIDKAKSDAKSLQAFLDEE